MDPSTKSPTTLLLVAAMVFSLFSATTPAAERITHIHTDALGSPVAATDEQGNIIWREKYQPYGERIANAPAASSNKRWYTGHQQDTETGLVYAGARYYDPTLGRFMAVDPVSFTEKNPHSFNRYSYANNNPYMYIDPDGKEVFKIPLTSTYMYVGSGGIAFATSGELSQQHPGLNQLTPTMQEPARRVLFEMEGRGWQPTFVESPLRTPAQQAEKVRDKVSQTMDSKHLDQDGQGAGAMDIMDRRWGQVDRTKAQQDFFRQLGAVGKGEGLIWGGDFLRRGSDGGRRPNPRTGYGWDPAHLEQRQ